MTCWCIGVFEIVSSWYHSSLNSSQFRHCRERLFCLKISKLCGSNSTASNHVRLHLSDHHGWIQRRSTVWAVATKAICSSGEQTSGFLFPALRLEEPHCRQFCSCHVMLQHVYWWCFCQHQWTHLNHFNDWSYSRYSVHWSILKYIEVYWSILKYIEVYWSILKYIEVYWSVQNWGSRWFQDFPDIIFGG